MQPNLEDQAVKAALESDWNTAITLNLEILRENPNHIPALNRLAKAYTQMGERDKAIAAYEQVLCLDKFNTIAQKKCALLKTGPCQPTGCAKIVTTDFIEERGKTKTTALVRLADNGILNNLQPGQLVNLIIKNHWIAVTTQDNTYIGSLADNVSYNLKQFIAGGNQFQAVIRTAEANQVSVFIRETYRAPQFANTPSF